MTLTLEISTVEDEATIEISRTKEGNISLTICAKGEQFTYSKQYPEEAFRPIWDRLLNEEFALAFATIVADDLIAENKLESERWEKHIESEKNILRSKLL